MSTLTLKVPDIDKYIKKCIIFYHPAFCYHLTLLHAAFLAHSPAPGAFGPSGGGIVVDEPQALAEKSEQIGRHVVAIVSEHQRLARFG